MRSRVRTKTNKKETIKETKFFQSTNEGSLSRSLCRKARRKERDGDQNSTDTKLYLEESVLERKLPEADLKALVDLPAGLDYNEWLASHSE